MPTPRKTEAPKIYQLKVTLGSTKPPVWRRFQVRSDVPLDALHLILQQMMGWSNCHLYSFDVRGDEYGEPHSDYGDEMLDAHRVSLGQALRGVGEKCFYLYDFGDGWEHTLLLEKIVEPEPTMAYPVCLTGKRNCPPEDCGGPWGYLELLRVLGDPEDTEHKEMLEWVGGSFDPEEFDCEEINRSLSRRVAAKK